MNGLHHEVLIKKSVTINMDKLRKVRRLLHTGNDSETIRVLIDRELTLRQALRANQKLRRSGGGIQPILWR